MRHSFDRKVKSLSQSFLDKFYPVLKDISVFCIGHLPNLSSSKRRQDRIPTMFCLNAEKHSKKYAYKDCIDTLLSFLTAHIALHSVASFFSFHILILIQ